MQAIKYVLVIFVHILGEMLFRLDDWYMFWGLKYSLTCSLSLAVFSFLVYFIVLHLYHMFNGYYACNSMPYRTVKCLCMYSKSSHVAFGYRLKFLMLSSHWCRWAMLITFAFKGLGVIAMYINWENFAL